MAVLSGFFNAVNGDRLYDADSMNGFYEGFVQEGVLSPVGDWLQVTEGGAMRVTVGTGKAWFRNTWIHNTTPYTLDIVGADASYDRYDSVVLDFNKDERKNDILVITGNPDPFDNPQPPTLFDTPTHLQVEIARVSVVAGAVSITQSAITNKIGVTQECPFATGLLEQASAEDLAAEWSAEFYAWKFDIEQQLDEIDSSGTLTELTDIRNRPLYNRNILVNGSFEINQRFDKNTDLRAVVNEAFSTANPYDHVGDRWVIGIENSTAVFSATRRSLGNGRRSLRLICNTSDAVLSADSRIMLSQRVEGSRLQEMYKGYSGTKSLTLGFKFRSNREGYYVAELHDVDNARSVSTSFYHSGNGGENDYSVTFGPDATGVIQYDENRSLDVNFYLAAGTDYTAGGVINQDWNYLSSVANQRAWGQVNGVSTSGGYFEWREIQLEVGTIRSLYEKKPLDDILRECRRYYEFIEELWVHGVGWTDSDRIVITGRPHSVPKRAVPDYSYVSGVVQDMGGNSGWGTTGWALWGPDHNFHKDYLAIQVNSVNNLIDARPYLMQFAHFEIDAEL